MINKHMTSVFSFMYMEASEYSNEKRKKFLNGMGATSYKC